MLSSKHFLLHTCTSIDYSFEIREPMANASLPVGPADASLVPRYAGIATFARLPRLEDVPRADIAIVGIPFDSGVSYRPGARFGPAHVREASRLLRPYNSAQNVEPFDITEAITQIQETAAALSADGKRLITIGGDHTIALPCFASLPNTTGLSRCFTSTHTSTRGTPTSAPQLPTAPRSAAPRRKASSTWRPASMWASAVRSTPATTSATTNAWASPSSPAMSSRPRGSPLPLNGCSPASATARCTSPSTSTYSTLPTRRAQAPPEAGGMTSRELLAMIRALRSVNLVGADIVEVAPAYDHAQLTAIAASHVAYEILSAMTPAAE